MEDLGDNRSGHAERGAATSGWLKAVRAFVVLGIVATMVSLVMTTLHLRAEQVLYPAVGAASSAAACTCFPFCIISTFFISICTPF
ncbi:hypothetical protein MAR_010120 [Mya arenaria]|uniref:CASP-like protein n=1 Tax=Mya arenaria TaxID=6604 RepID=A0ABY7E0N5_MYAAR|nr:hypothetical protein MAR_010120 [Mya arenaria]